MRFGLISILLLTFVCAAHAGPRKSGSELVQMKLLADVASIEPGKPFTVGVLLKIEPAWHIYWINPGDAGAATQVKFDLPSGFSAGELQFPTPVKRVDMGDIVSYGYTDEVMLLATITPPTDLHAGATIKITANADWLVCEKICLPGEGAASIELPVSQKVSPANNDLFTKWQRRLPVPAESLSGVDVHVSGPLDLTKGEGSVDVFSSVRDQELIPGPLDGATVVITKPKSVTERSVAVVRVSPLPGQMISAKFLEVLLVHEYQGERLAYDLKIPIVASASANNEANKEANKDK